MELYKKNPVAIAVAAVYAISVYALEVYVTAKAVMRVTSILKNRKEK